MYSKLADVKLTVDGLEQTYTDIDKHNNVVERTYSLEQKAVVQEEQIKVANHRISDLEEKENGHV